jgi:hypothetical protein
VATLKYDAAALIATVRNRAVVGDTNAEGVRDADILRALNEELHTRLFPALVKIREEYNIATVRIPLVAGTSRYRVPTRAAGQRIRDVLYCPSSDSRRLLTRVARESRGRYGTSSDEPSGWYLEWNHIVLVPEIGSTATGSLEVSFPVRPSEIVLVAETGVIQTVDTTTGVVNLLAARPAGFVAGAYDIHSPSSGAELRVFDVTAALGPAADELTFTAADINGSAYGKYVPQVGDYVCLAGECAIPPLPRELHPLLGLAGARSVLLANGDHQTAGEIEKELQARLDDATMALLDDRVEGEPEVISPTYSFLGRGRARGGANEFGM